MSRTTTGTILSVQAVTQGSVLNAAASTSDLTVTVADATDFDSESGGSLAINGTVYQYASADDDTGIITLTGTGLAAGAADGDRVDVWNTARNAAAIEYRALVELPGDVDNADALDARISLPLVLQLPLGQRESGEGEVVVLTEQDDEWVVTDLPGSDPAVGPTLIPTIQDSDFLLDLSGGRLLMYAASNPVVAVDDTTPGTRTYTVGAGITVIKREGWGGGGGGGGRGTAGGILGGGGGGGGGYACDPVIVVNPGDVISYTVGAAGTAGAGSGSGGDGGDSTMGTLVADGGKGGTADIGSGGSGGAGGATNTGETMYRGGHGASTSTGNGGGSSAAPTQDGADTTGVAGAAGPGTDAGSGGSGAFLSPSTAGSPPGGGGGGGGGANDGSAGGVGRIRITAFTGAPLIASIAALPGTDPVAGQAYPAGVMIYPNTVTDWNTITTPGTYIGIASAQTNSPLDTRTWVGETYGRLETGTLVQVVNRLATVDNPEIWTRQFSSTGGWQPWHRVAGAVPASAYTDCINSGTYTKDATFPLQVYRDINGVCWIRGRMNRSSNFGTGAFASTMTLPSSAFAPAFDFNEPIASANATDLGIVRVTAGSTTIQISALTGTSTAAFFINKSWQT